jgi:hypothetical protein
MEWAGTFAAVAAGFYWSLGLRTDGTLAAWGDNTYGELNVPPGRFASIAAGGNHGPALVPTPGTVVVLGAAAIVCGRRRRR